VSLDGTDASCYLGAWAKGIDLPMLMGQLWKWNINHLISRYVLAEQESSAHLYYFKNASIYPDKKLQYYWMTNGFQSA
jgi:hypothetical protein